MSGGSPRGYLCWYTDSQIHHVWFGKDIHCVARSRAADATAAPTSATAAPTATCTNAPNIILPRPLAFLAITIACPCPSTSTGTGSSKIPTAYVFLAPPPCFFTMDKYS